MRRERLRVGERGMIAEECQVAGLVGCDQLLHEQPAEQAREHAHRQEEAGAARHPALAVERDAAARHDHVDVRVMGHGRAPGMEHGSDADAGTEVLWGSGDRGQGLGRDLEQQIVDDRLVVTGDVADRRRQREHDMEVRHRQQICFARRKPVLCRRALALRAVTVAARVVRDLGVCALLAARDMSAERRGAAALDCRHHLQLAEADMAGIGPAPCRAVAAEDVRNLQRWTRHEEPRVRRAARPSRPYGRYAPAGSRLPESSWWRRVYRAPWYRAWRARAVMRHTTHPLISLKLKGWLSRIWCYR